jgi:shikimate dehydrogenase
MKAGLIGHPVAQSKSPIIHHYWMKQYGIKGQYDLFDTKPEDLEAIVKRLVSEGYDGFNITVPHKENILPLCDMLNENAKQVGAVNTVHIKENLLYGYNTDVYGFVENIKTSIPDFEGAHKTALILGAGGAARAAIQGLKNEGFKKIYIANRTKEKAEKLQDDFGNILDVIDWEIKEKNNRNIDLLVNTTSLGMVNKPSLDFDLKDLKQGAIIYDIVYNPLETDLLKNAKNKQYQIVTGIGMLIYQAVPAFRLWTGTKPALTKDLQMAVL